MLCPKNLNKLAGAGMSNVRRKIRDEVLEETDKTDIKSIKSQRKTNKKKKTILNIISYHENINQNHSTISVSGMIIIEKKYNNKCWQAGREMGTSGIAGEDIKWCGYAG